MKIEEEFAYFTECNLATFESMKLRKSTPRGELKRQEDICIQMVNVCKEFYCPTRRGSWNLPRLQDKLGEKEERCTNCGHGKSWHFESSRTGYGCNIPNPKCNCKDFVFSEDRE